MNDNCYTIANGVTGISAAIMSYMATLMQDVDVCARIAASGVGIIVGVLTAINLIRSLKRK